VHIAKRRNAGLKGFHPVFLGKNNGDRHVTRFLRPRAWRGSRFAVPVIRDVGMGVDHSWNSGEAAEIDHFSARWDAAIGSNADDLVVFDNDDRVVDHLMTVPELAELNRFRRRIGGNADAKHNNQKKDSNTKHKPSPELILPEATEKILECLGLPSRSPPTMAGSESLLDSSRL